MKILLVYPNIGTVNSVHYHHGIGALSAALIRAGHQTRLFYCEQLPEREEFLREVRRFDPGMVGFSFNSHQWKYIREMAGWMAESHPVPTVAGGTHPTHSPEEVISQPGIDMVCRGEGDEAIVELAAAVASGADPSSIANLWVRRGEEVVRNEIRPLIQDMDGLPFPDRGIFDMEAVLRENEFAITMMAGRGCPLNCHYCCNSALMKLYRGRGSFVRFRSVDNVLEEIELLAGRYNFTSLFFDDDVFTLRRDWVEGFCMSYRRSFRFPFSINLRVDKLDREMIVMLKDAGLYGVRVGVESGNERIRREVMNRRMTNEQIERVFGWLHEMDIHSRSYNIIGMPGDTPETIRETMRLNERLMPDQIQVSTFQPYPGTHLYELCRSKGYLSGRERSTFFAGDSVLDLPELPPEAIRELYKEFCDMTDDVDRRRFHYEVMRGRSGYYDFLVNLPEAELEYGDPESIKADSFDIYPPRHVIFEHPVARLTYRDIKIEEDTDLRLGIAVSPRVVDEGLGRGARFRVAVNNGSEYEVFNHYIDPQSRLEDRRWHDFEVDLSFFAGSTVSISFITEPGESGDIRCVWTGWSRPHLRRRDRSEADNEEGYLPWVWSRTPRGANSPEAAVRQRDARIAVLEWQAKERDEVIESLGRSKSPDELLAALYQALGEDTWNATEGIDDAGEKASLSYPDYNSPEVKEASEYLLSLIKINPEDSRPNSFLLEYLGQRPGRTAMNIVFLKKHIKPGDSYLDVGSMGVEPAIIKKEFPACTVKALSDIGTGKVVWVGPKGFYEAEDSKNPDSVHIEELDVERQRFPYPDDSFDIITCFEVLEHLKFDPVFMMKEIKRVLRPDGMLVLTTPNINSAQSIARILRGESPQESPFFHNPGKYTKYGELPERYRRCVIHPKEYTVEQVRDLCLSLGFKIETLGSMDTSRPTGVEQMVARYLPLLIPHIERAAGRPAFKLTTGERTVLVARKGGPVISETPATIFEQ
jgi:radical SAM superfamily enzyme YgiQ (UPF0313 family)/SAM-dependent methyltransferase